MRRLLTRKPRPASEQSQQAAEAGQPTTSSASNIASPPEQSQTDDAWKLLSVVNEWVRFADTKAAVALAFAGALAALLFNLVTDLRQMAVLLDVVVVLTSTLLVATAVLCGLTLAPRTSDNELNSGEEVNRVFFASIATHFKNRRLEYRDVLRTLTTDPSSLVQDLADQIHANAQIALTKSRYVKWAIRCVLLAGLSLAACAIIVGLMARF